MKLYELSEQYQAMLDELEEMEEEPTPEQWSAILSIEGDFDAKVIAYGKVIRTLEAQEEVVRGEIARLQKRAKSLSGRAFWLRTTLLSWLQNVGREKVKDAVLSVSIRSCPMSVEVQDESKVPEAFVKVERHVSKSLILEHVKTTGEIPDGVSVVTDKKTLSIR